MKDWKRKRKNGSLETKLEMELMGGVGKEERK